MKNISKKNLYEPNSDPEYVKRMVEFLGSNHHNIVLNNIDLARALDDATKAADLPGMADVDSSLYLFAKRSKEICDRSFIRRMCR